MLHVARAESNVILNDETRTLMQGLQLECCLWCWEYLLEATRVAFSRCTDICSKDIHVLILD